MPGASGRGDRGSVGAGRTGCCEGGVRSDNLLYAQCCRAESLRVLAHTLRRQEEVLLRLPARQPQPAAGSTPARPGAQLRCRSDPGPGGMCRGNKVAVGSFLLSLLLFDFLVAVLARPDLWPHSCLPLAFSGQARPSGVPSSAWCGPRSGKPHQPLAPLGAWQHPLGSSR